MCSIQKEDGAWFDSTDTAPYIFDTAQIIKGLLAIRCVLPEVDNYIKKACDWILSFMQEDGRLPSPSTGAWGNDENFCSEIVHLYCLSPLKEAGVVFDNPKYIEASKKILKYYIKNQISKISQFSLLSHFYAYVIEGLIDMGEENLAKEGLLNLEKYQDEDGFIPGLKNVTWTCSTGLFQIALCWYKLGKLEEGNKIFNAACKLQNETGGWYGSYTVKKQNLCNEDIATYFPNAEISWANKYFLDALYYKENLEFEKMSDIFLDKIDKKDGRYELIHCIIKNMIKESKNKVKICDLGCGKGRYIKNIIEDFNLDTIEITGVDISSKVMKSLSENVNKVQGRLTNLPLNKEEFDMIICCEALEHAINIDGAMQEMYRIAKPNSIIVIVDKPIEKLGSLSLYEWEQWIDSSFMQKFACAYDMNLQVVENLEYEEKRDGLFKAWIFKKGSICK